MHLSKMSTLKEILADSEGKAIVEKYIGEEINNPMLQMAMEMNLETIAMAAGDKMPATLIEAIDRDLRNIGKEEINVEAKDMTYIIGKNDISEGWLFTKSEVDVKNPEMTDAEAINIPHTWNALDGQDGGNDYHRGECFYKKELLIDESYNSKNLYLEFEAANSVAKVYVNGKFLTVHRGGYSTFRVNITDVVKFDEANIILVSVDNSHIEEVYPLMADFTFGGGLYRKVSLQVTNDVHFDMMDHGSPAVFVSQKNITDELAVIGIDAKMVNEAVEPVKVKWTAELKDHEGNVLKQVAQEAIVHDQATFIDEMSLENPTLWQGVENPYLYTVESKLFVNNELVDDRIIPTGLRYYVVDPEKGFFLNGKPWKLNGVSRHQCRRDMGWALTEKEQIEDMEIIKEMGANSIRLAHYQHNQYFYDLCDLYGMVIWAEIPYISMSSKTDPTGENAKSQMVELIRQNYNHSSICFWGVQNEITIAGQLNRTPDIVKSLNELTKKEDPYRVTTQAQVGHHPDEDGMNYITDTLAYNKYYGWYYDEVEDFDVWLTNFKQKNPNTPLGISEYGCEAILQYHTDEPKRSDYTEEYQTLYHEKVLQIFDKHEQIWGTYVWNMFDFACDMRDEGGVKGMNNKGLVTHDRKTRKDSFYWYKANWASEPVLHLTSKRFVDRVSSEIEVKVYSNLDSVTLFVNGEEIGTMTSDNHVFKFENVKITDGNNDLKVVSGEHVDTSIVNKVDEANESYICTDQSDHAVDNWFDDAGLDTDIKELEYPDGFYSIKDSIGDIISNEDGDAILRKYMAAMFEHAMFDMVKGMTLEMIAQMQSGISEVLVYNINKELNEVRK
ncbi:MAG: DUF4982 domain-containing protein [Clostridiales bacterium]|nr:DUF4982 domain-containing protein [Clostridiales bacterium]